MPSGHCIECDNGDWYCPDQDGGIGAGDCPTGGGLSGWKKVGETWYDQEGSEHEGYYIWVRAVCEDGEPVVDVWLQKVKKTIGHDFTHVYVPEGFMNTAIREMARIHPDFEWPAWVTALIQGSGG